jgi:acyl-CoA hydrolase
MGFPPWIDLDAAVDRLSALSRAAPPGEPARIILPGGAMEAIALAEAFAARPERAAGLCFSGLFVPGVNRFDWAALHPAARMEVGVPGADWAATIADGRTRWLPTHYSTAHRWLTRKGLAAQVLHLSPPGPDGLCAIGFSADLAPGLAADGGFTLGLINPHVPEVAGAPRVRPDLCDALCEAPAPLRLTPAAADGPAALVKAVAERVVDGACVQIGIGRLPGAILRGLVGHRDLRMRSGLVGAELAALLDAGAIAEAPGALVAGLVLGDADFLARMAEEPRLRLAPVNETHDPARMAAEPAFFAINAALEADLTGQINCEHAGGRRVSGVGGAMDFMRGARASPGGEAITMIQAQGRDGTSRIVRALAAAHVSIPRADADVIVTEFGAACLRHLDEGARAAAMIGLAPPDHRAALGEGGTA